MAATTRPDVAWDSKIAFVLGLLGVYTFAFGFLAQTDLLKRFPSLGDDLTSPNPLKFLAGGFQVLSLLQISFPVGAASERTPESLERRGAALLWLIQFPVLLLGFFAVAAYTVVYLLLMAPIAWLAYSIVSIPLDSISGSARDTAMVLVDRQTGEEQQVVSIKEVVNEHMITLRNLLVAIPSLVSSLILGTPALV
jgi:hypothetical protein